MTRGWGITPVEGKRNSYKFLLWRPKNNTALSLRRRGLKDVKKVKDVPVHDLKAQRGTGIISQLVCRLGIRRRLV